MLKIFIYMSVGSIIGFFFAAILSVAKDADKDNELNNKWLVYKCHINKRTGCSDYCCIHCDKKEECKYVPCSGNPKECNQANISLR